jgi:hypothetical protein
LFQGYDSVDKATNLFYYQWFNILEVPLRPLVVLNWVRALFALCELPGQQQGLSKQSIMSFLFDFDKGPEPLYAFDKLPCGAVQPSIKKDYFLTRSIFTVFLVN